MLGFDGEYTAGHPKGKFFTFMPETCEKSPLKHFLENLVLLSFVIYLQSLVQECLRKHTFISNIAPYFLVFGLSTEISPYSVRIQKNMDQK